jgi:hypothetical protein
MLMQAAALPELRSRLSSSDVSALWTLMFDAAQSQEGGE